MSKNLKAMFDNNPDLKAQNPELVPGQKKRKSKPKLNISPLTETTEHWLQQLENDVADGILIAWEYVPEHATAIGVMKDGRLRLLHFPDQPMFNPDNHKSGWSDRIALAPLLLEEQTYLCRFMYVRSGGDLKFLTPGREKSADNLHSWFGWLVKPDFNTLVMNMVNGRVKSTGAERSFASKAIDEAEGLLAVAVEPFAIRMIGQTYTPDLWTWVEQGTCTVYEVKGAHKLGSDGRARVKFAMCASEYTHKFVEFQWAKQNKGGGWTVGPLRKQSDREKPYWLD